MKVVHETGKPGRVLVLEIDRVGEIAFHAGMAVATVISLAKGRMVTSLEVVTHEIRVRTLSEEEGLHEWGVTIEARVKQAIAGMGNPATPLLPRSAEG